MTLHVYLGGVEVDESRVLLPMDAGLSENADGTAARAGLVFDDPAGDFDLTAWTELVVEEDDCDVLRLFTGFVISRGISRGPYRDGAARMWDCDVIDLNEWLHFTVLQGNRDDAQRPRETGTDRIAWLMGTLGMDGVVFDNGEVANNAWIYDDTDYRGQYADDVLRDIVSASGVGRWTVFLYWDESAASGEELSLFYNDVSAAVRTSDIRISNLISDQDADTFYPIVDASLARDPSDQCGGVYTILPVGRIYRINPTTVTAMGLPNPRDAVYESARINNAETAERHANTFLQWHSLEIDSVTVTIELPSTRVNHVKAGDRLEVKFTHLPGYESFVWMRVQSRTILSLSADRSMYLVRLVLSLKGVLQAGGGGDPGITPNPPPAPGQDHFYEVTLTDTTPNHGPDAGVLDPGAGANFQPDTLYNWFAEITASTGIAGTSAFVGIALHNDSGADYSLNTTWSAGVVSPALSGSFTTASGTPDNPIRLFLNAIHNDVSDISATVHFYVDPDGWVPIAGSSGRPARGQWIDPPEVVTMTGADGTTAWPFADGSLHVYVDDTEQTSKLVSQDGATGDFTLGFTPTPTEVVTVRYQGR